MYLTDLRMYPLHFFCPLRQQDKALQTSAARRHSAALLFASYLRAPTYIHISSAHKTEETADASQNIAGGMATSKLVGQKATRRTAHYRSQPQEEWQWITTLQKNRGSSSSQILMVARGDILCIQTSEIVVCYL